MIKIECYSYFICCIKSLTTINFLIPLINDSLRKKHTGLINFCQKSPFIDRVGSLFPIIDEIFRTLLDCSNQPELLPATKNSNKAEYHIGFCLFFNAKHYLNIANSFIKCFVIVGFIHLAGVYHSLNNGF